MPLSSPYRATSNEWSARHHPPSTAPQRREETMSAKKAQEPLSINLEKLCTTMLELAGRGPHEESLMLQVANAGNVLPVSKEIKRRRMSRAKFTKRDKTETAAPQASGKKKQTRKRKSTNASAGTGEPQADHSASGVGLQHEG